MATPLEEIRKRFSTLMDWHGEELMPVDFVMASYLSTYLPGAVEKPWGDLIGGASTGKGELLRCLSGMGSSIVRHTITANAFASAYRDPDNPKRDPSLLATLSETSEPKGRKVLILPELTPFLRSNQEQVQKFFGDLRAVYDGEFGVQAGNIGAVNYKLQFGMLTGCTEILDDYRKVNQTLGERTLVCRVARHLTTYGARRRLALHLATVDLRVKTRQRHELAEAVGEAMERAIEHLADTARDPTGNGYRESLTLLGNLAVSCRTVPLSRTSFVHSAEASPRFTHQLAALGDSRIIFDGRSKWTDSDISFVRRIAQDTQPPENLRLIQTIYRRGAEEATTPMTTQDIVRASRVDGPVATRQLAQWSHIGFLSPRDDRSYSLPHEVAEDIHTTGFMEGL